jgi:hypothetical protein
MNSAVIITLSSKTSDILVRGGRMRQSQRIESHDFKLGAAFRARENLAAVDIEIGDRDGVPARRARGIS